MNITTTAQEMTTNQIEARIAEIRGEIKWHTPIQQNLLRVELAQLKNELDAR